MSAVASVLTFFCSASAVSRKSSSTAGSSFSGAVAEPPRFPRAEAAAAANDTADLPVDMRGEGAFPGIIDSRRSGTAIPWPIPLDRRLAPPPALTMLSRGPPGAVLKRRPAALPPAAPDIHRRMIDGECFAKWSSSKTISSLPKEYAFPKTSRRKPSRAILLGDR